MVTTMSIIMVLVQVRFHTHGMIMLGIHSHFKMQLLLPKL